MEDFTEWFPHKPDLLLCLVDISLWNEYSTEFLVEEKYIQYNIKKSAFLFLIYIGV